MPSIPDLSRVVTGPAEVKVDGVSVGRTSGPVKARFTPLLREETCAYTGASPVDYVVVGTRAEIVMRLADHVLENTLLAMPHAAYGYGYASVGMLPGTRLSASAAAVTVHPLALDAGDTSEDVTLHHAACVGVVELSYAPGEDRLVEARFVGLVDISREDGDLAARIASPQRT
ncbi:MAG: hypothetical protein ACYS9X_32760 [Planctomycetota bacterium]|jgi:hypothetical protein